MPDVPAAFQVDNIIEPKHSPRKQMEKSKEIQISVDLVDAALAHRQFLKLVNEHPGLYAGPHVQNAIRR